MRALLLIALVLLGTAPAWAAEEPSGCDKFKWNIDRERAALTAPDRIKLASGAELATLPSTGITLGLSAPAEAKLPSPPERAPKEGTFAGFAAFKNALPPGRYTISLSAAGWIDVVQDGQFLRSITSSGVSGLRRNPKEREIRDSVQGPSSSRFPASRPIQSASRSCRPRNERESRAFANPLGRPEALPRPDDAVDLTLRYPDGS